MEIKKRVVPISAKGEPIENAGERDLIYFRVLFNNYRDVSGSYEHTVLDREELDECECVLTLPKSYTEDGDETPFILSFHGAGGTVCEEKNTVGGLAHVFQCVDAGYAALDVCGSKPNGLTFGCPEHLFAIYKAYRYATKHYNLSKSVLLCGSSMGAQVAMNFANTFPSIVLAIGLFYPRLNIDSATVNGHFCLGTWDKTALRSDGLSTREHIRNVFRFPADEWNETLSAGFNPYRSRSFIDRDGQRILIPPCPVKVWQGMEDQTVDPVMAQEFVNSIRRAGCYAELHMLEGLGHKASPIMREELRMWFNRFI